MKQPIVLVGLFAAGLFLLGCGDEVPESPSALDGQIAVEEEITVDEQIAVEEQSAPTGVVTYDVVVVNSYPHDEGAYTQGLEFVDGLLLESTGRVGSSSIRLVDPETGAVVEQRPLAEPLYGEGATLVGDEVWQLTYRSETVIVHSLDGLNEQRRFAYSGEGWGLCYTGSQLIMSNGSAELAVREAESFTEVDSMLVTLNGEPVEKLNELECAGEVVWANVYQTNEILAIDGSTGEVRGRADLSQLVPDGFENSNNLVLNGIAYNEETERFWVTGKQWPIMYEIELSPPP